MLLIGALVLCRLISAWMKFDSRVNFLNNEQLRKPRASAIAGPRKEPAPVHWAAAAGAWSGVVKLNAVKHALRIYRNFHKRRLVLLWERCLISLSMVAFRAEPI